MHASTYSRNNMSFVVSYAWLLQTREQKATSSGLLQKATPSGFLPSLKRAHSQDTCFILQLIHQGIDVVHGYPSRAGGRVFDRNHFQV
jgi:hypothetical protein